MEQERITAEEVKRRMDTGEASCFSTRAPMTSGEKRSSRSRNRSGCPDGVEAHLDEIPRRGLIVSYCA